MRRTLPHLLNGLLFGTAAAVGIGLGAWLMSTPPQNPPLAAAAATDERTGVVDDAVSPPELLPAPNGSPRDANVILASNPHSAAIHSTVTGAFVGEQVERPAALSFGETNPKTPVEKNEIRFDGPEVVVEFAAKVAMLGEAKKLTLRAVTDDGVQGQAETKDVAQAGTVKVRATFSQIGEYRITSILLDEEGRETKSDELRLRIKERTPSEPPRIEWVSIDEKGLLRIPHERFAGNRVLPLTGSSLQLQANVSGIEGRTYTVLRRTDAGDVPLLGGNDLDTAAEVSGSEHTFKSLTPLPEGVHQISVRDNWSGLTSERTATVRIRVPEKDAGFFQPIVREWRNGEHASFVALTPNDRSVTTYNRFLGLAGTNQSRNASLEFLVFTDVDGTGSAEVYEEFERPTARVELGAAGTWKSTLTLPRLSDQSPSKLFVLAEADNNHRLSEPFNFAIEQSVSEIKQKPELALVKTGAGTRTITRDEQLAAYPLNTTTIAVVGKENSVPANMQVLAFLNDGNEPFSTFTGTSSPSTWNFEMQLPQEGSHTLSFAFAKGADVGPRSDPVNVIVRRRGPRVVSVEPRNVAVTSGRSQVRIQFDSENPLKLDADFLTAPSSTVEDELGKYFELRRARGSGSPLEVATELITGGTFDADSNTITLTLSDPPADSYQLTIKGGAISDKFENKLEGSPGKPGTNYVAELSASATAEPEIGTPGRTFVEYPEFTRPRDKPNGFNPSDRVETRVVRLYYYRDAHRVAQIVNREVRSYNRQGAQAAQQVADKARTEFDQLQTRRRLQERQAERAAAELREAENELRDARTRQFEARRTKAGNFARLAALQSQLDALPDDEANAERRRQLELDERRLENADTTLDQQIVTAQREIDDASRAVERLNATANTEQDKMEKLQLDEGVAAKDLFRLEVAAATEDPDTFAAGDPKSDDPVKQVSVSVIGEGVIQLRGPIKGLNVIRRMINRIDAPVGQTRVAMHTVQVNGDHGDRMEVVVERIQKHIDHSRFLTMQSALMLRKAVQAVASQKAEEAAQMFPGHDQAARDRRYLYNFFGRDFTDELYAIDSEFLHTGNKVLSLHSMDTTSLAGALFVMALAKNSTRTEILDEFRRMVGHELPRAEMEFYEQSLGVSCKSWRKPKCFVLLGENARFRSFAGFFDSSVLNDDLMTPVQRDFVRLAQIFKARLVTERELQLRVMERALIEDRLGNYQEELLRAKNKEDLAEQERLAAKRTLDTSRNEVFRVLSEFQSSAQEVVDDTGLNVVVRTHDEDVSFGEGMTREDASVSLANYLADLSWVKDPAVDLPLADNPQVAATRPAGEGRYDLYDIHPYRGVRFIYFRTRDEQGREVVYVAPDVEQPPAFDRNVLHRVFIDAVATHRGRIKRMQTLAFPPAVAADLATADSLVSGLETFTEKFVSAGQINPAFPLPVDQFRRLELAYRYLYRVHSQITSFSRDIERRSDDIRSTLSELEDVNEAFQTWIDFREHVITYVRDPELRKRTFAQVGLVDDQFRRLVGANLGLRLAQDNARDSRRPLDHKKMLDMLIDQVEERYIELVEGTRAHTANVDDYVKRLATALEDDFNTQFYNPAFQQVRRASQYYDVTLGQVETTSVLANNRSFAKVEPQATYEFDLPKRDILVTEALASAKAAVDTYGALAADPTFLSMAKLYSGQPTSSPGQGTTVGSPPPIRDVLPTLPGDFEQRLMQQQAANPGQFQTAFEGLIPDPAIYKFETGTGFEIRPVIQPDGQSVVFRLNYLYTTNVREPVRADEKHLGRVKRHFVNTDVQLGNYELREVSKYTVALKAARTSRGVPLLEDAPVIGGIFRPLASDESALQQNIILSQAVIYPTLFDLMGLRWAPAVADLDPLALSNTDFVTKNRGNDIWHRVFDYTSSQVDDFMRTPEAERRGDLYRSQGTIPRVHPNGYEGPGLDLQGSTLREGADGSRAYSRPEYVPNRDPDGAKFRYDNRSTHDAYRGEPPYLHELPPGSAPTEGETMPTYEEPEGAGSHRIPDGLVLPYQDSRAEPRRLEPRTSPPVEVSLYRVADPTEVFGHVRVAGAFSPAVTRTKPTPPPAPRYAKPAPRQAGTPSRPSTVTRPRPELQPKQSKSAKMKSKRWRLPNPFRRD